MSRLKFRYRCVDCPSSGKRFDELMYIIDHMRYVSFETFKKMVGDKPEFHRKWDIPPGGRYYPKGRPWYKDTIAFQFFKSRLPDGRPVYGFQYSGIEYVWY